MFELAVIGRSTRSSVLQKAEAYAPSLYNRAKATCGAEKMHASILGILAADLVPFGFEGVIRSYSNPRQIDFRSFGREKRALFVTIDDMDRSLDKLTSLFIQQAFSSCAARLIAITPITGSRCRSASCSMTLRTCAYPTLTMCSRSFVVARSAARWCAKR